MNKNTRSSKVDLMPEEKYEKYFRAHRLMVPSVSLIVLAGLYCGIVFCQYEFRKAHYWTVLPAAIMAHAYFIIAIHDGSHRAITRSKWDDLFMNVFAGLLLLPFFAEPFRRYHMIHHANTNTENDPLWSPLKGGLYKRNRGLFILCQMIPLLFTLTVLLSGEKKRKRKNIKGPKIRYGYMAVAFLCSGAVIYFFPPALMFYLFTLIVLTFLGAVRHWCEHMGTRDNVESNTFWFPLGMGVGNHAIHHDIPTISWLSLALGLRYRKYETDPFRTLVNICSKRSFRHYTAHLEQNSGKGISDLESMQ